MILCNGPPWANMGASVLSSRWPGAIKRRSCWPPTTHFGQRASKQALKGGHQGSLRGIEQARPPFTSGQTAMNISLSGLAPTRGSFMDYRIERMSIEEYAHIEST